MAELPRHRLGDLERKLLTLYSLRELGPCTNLQLIAFMVENDLMNYFDLQTALHDLCQNSQLARDSIPGDDRYEITPLGDEAIGLFMKRLGESAVQRVQQAAPGFREKIRMQREKFASISHAGRNEYHTQMGIAEGGMQLMRLDLSLPTADLAERFRAAWPEKAAEIYSFILSRLSGEDLL